MIFDTIDNAKMYAGLGRVSTALDFLAATDFSAMELGRYELDGENIYYMVQEYVTEAKPHAEAHEQYIDIQYLLSGKESIGVAPLTTEKTVVEVKEGKDCTLYDCTTQPITVEGGQFMVLYPNDIHRPGDLAGAPCPVRKVVVKVKVE